MASDLPRKETTTVTIRHVPMAVHLGLQTHAKQARQSMQDYLLEQLSRIATRPTMADVLARAEARKDSRVTKEDLVRFGDEDRDR
jgi:antitoxin FitA